MEQFQPQPKAMPPVNKQEQTMEFSATQETMKSPEVSIEQQTRASGERAAERTQEISKLSESATATQDKINEIRKSLGMAPTTEEPPSVVATKARMEKLTQRSGSPIEIQQPTEEFAPEPKTEQTPVDKLEEKQLNQEILQGKLEELFNEFNSLSPEELQSVILTGKTLLGINYVSQAFGMMQPSFAHLLAISFREGITSLPQIMEMFPEITESFEQVMDTEAESTENNVPQEEVSMNAVQTPLEEKPIIIKEQEVPVSPEELMRRNGERAPMEPEAKEGTNTQATV